MKQLFTAFFLLLLSFYSVYSCTLAGKSLEDFDIEEYIFIGEVINYTNPVKSRKLTSQAYGLVVKTKESVNLPKIAKNFYEVFPIQLFADCSESGMNLEELKKLFPLKMEVRVIAKEAKILTQLTDGNIRLENRPGELGSISIHTEEDKKSISSKDKLFDYKSFKYLTDEYRGIYSRLPDYEVRKDLYRLKNSKSQAEIKSILQNFLDISICCMRCCDDLEFYSIFKKYSTNEKELKKFWETHLRETSPEIFEQYKILDYVESKLTSLGYRKKYIDKAIEKAMIEGIELEKQQLFERCLQILKATKKKSKS